MDAIISNKLETLQAKRPTIRTNAERSELLRLPNTIVLLETRALALAQELGSELILPNRSGKIFSF
jgi:hypothetical protein